MQRLNSWAKPRVGIDAVEGDGGAIDRAERGRVSGVDWNGVAEGEFPEIQKMSASLKSIYPLVPYHGQRCPQDGLDKNRGKVGG